MEELGEAQPLTQQMLREDRKAGGEWDEPAEGLPLGHEPREGGQDGRGSEEVVPQGSHGDQEGDVLPEHAGGAGARGDGEGLQQQHQQPRQ